MKTLNIGIILLLLSILLLGCSKKAEELPDWQVDVSYVDEAYIGETSNFVVKVSKKCDITLYVDGTQQQSVSSTKMNFDVSTLSVGLHNIKISINDGYGTYDKSYQCRIKEKPVVYQKPTITCHKVEQANYGESSVITASTKTDSEMTLYVDGAKQQSTTSKTLSFDVVTLSVGTHQIKIVAVNGDKKDEVSFNCVIVKKTPLDIKYEYVDLNLPSGTLWATSNVGAENPWDYGDYFAWGEVTTKVEYSSDTYTFNDNTSTLDASHDAATVNMGSDWRMPTTEEFQELCDNCEIEWTSNYQGTGVAGRIVWDTDSHTTHIFFPASGSRNDGALDYADEAGYYWSSSLITNIQNWSYEEADRNRALDFFISSNFVLHPHNSPRCDGQSVRAVRCKKAEPANVEIEISLPSSIMIDGEKQMVYCKVNRNCDLIFYIDENQKNTGMPGTPTGFYWELSAYKPGEHTLTARAYIDGVVVAEKSLTYTVEAKQQPQTDDYVDLGLPSGTLWATCNVGAENPWDYGDYFAWGEVTTKDYYDWDTYKYCKGTENTMTKYCNESEYGYNGYTDNLTVLESEDDAATVNMGSDWRMPTQAEFQELKENCDWEWTDNYNGKGVSGYIVKSRRGSSLIFLPAAGYRHNSVLGNADSFGGYWSSSVDYRDLAWRLTFLTSGCSVDDGSRYCGFSVRPVRCKN